MNDADPLQDDLLALLDAHDLDAAMRLLDTRIAAAQVEQRAPLLLARGRLRLTAGDAHGAAQDLAIALELIGDGPARGVTLLALGEALFECGDLDAARRLLETALDAHLAPVDRSLATRLVARIDLAHGRLDDAISLLSRVAAEPAGEGHDADARAEAALDLAHALRLAGDARRAQAVLEELLVWAIDRPLWAVRVLPQLGTTLAFAGRYDLAIAQYTRALQFPLDAAGRARVLYNRAVAFRELHDTGAALCDLHAAWECLTEVEPTLAFDIQFLLGIVSRETGNPAAALEALGRAIDNAPTPDAEGRARLEVGITLAATGVHGLAAEEFSAAIALCTDDLDRERAYRYRAATRGEMGLPALALDDVTQALALTLDPDERARGAMTRAALLLELEREADAYAALREAPLAEVSLPQVRVQLAYQLGSLATRRGDIDIALEALGHALELALAGEDRQLLGQVLVNRGVALDIAGASDDALDAFRDAVRLAPSNEIVYQAWMNIGRVLTDRGRLREALDAFGSAAAAADDRDARAMAFLSRGSAAMRGGRYIDADADFTRILVLQPRDPIATQARYYRGLTANLLGQLERARDDLSVTIELERDRDNRAQALVERGLVALSAGDFRAAERDFREAAATFRRRAKRAEAHLHLAALLALDGACDAAMDELRLVQALDPSGEVIEAARRDPRFTICRDHPMFLSAPGAENEDPRRDPPGA